MHANGLHLPAMKRMRAGTKLACRISVGRHSMQTCESDAKNMRTLPKVRQPNLE